MATSSYTSQNDYNVFKARPSSLPINQIAQTFSALNQYWEQGASRIKSRFDQMLDLDLSKTENIQLRNEYSKKAQEDLKKLSSSDLTDPNVQRAGTSLFDNIFNDEAIVYDDQATKHRKKILADADRYRKEKNGKYYNEANLQYALDGWDDFINSPDRAAGAQYLKKAKEFTPYYNPMDEISKINKECGTNNASNEVAAGAYITGISDKSKTAKKIYGCLEAGLSPQAKQQMLIEGHVAYGKKYAELQQDFIESATDKKKFYQEELGSLQAQRAGLSKTKGNEQEVQALTQQIENLSSQVSDIDKDLDGDGKTSFGVRNWDEKFIKDNYDKLAYTAFSKRWKEAYSQAFATTDIQKTTKANPIYITEFTQNEINKRTQAGFIHDERMSDKEFGQKQILDQQGYVRDVALENLKFQQKLLLGQDDAGNKLDPIAKTKLLLQSGMHPDQIQQYVGTAKEEVKTNGTVLAQNIVELESKELEVDNDMLLRLKSVMSDNDLLNSIGERVDNKDDIRNIWRVANDYLSKSSANDPLAKQIIDARNLRHDNTLERTSIEGLYNTAKDKVKANNPEIHRDFEKTKQEVFTTLKSYTLPDGTVIDKQRALNIAEGNDPRFKVETMGSAINKNDIQAVYIRDRQTGVLLDDKKIPSIINGVYKLKRNNTKYSTNFNEKLDEELGKNVLTQRNVLLTGNVFTKGSMASSFISDLFGAELGEMGKDFTPVSKGGLDPNTGEINVQFYNKDGEIKSSSEIIGILGKSGAGNSNYAPVDENTVRLKIPGAQGILNIPKHDLVRRSAVDYAELNVNRNPSGIKLPMGTSKDRISYELNVSKKIGGGVTYEILGNGKPIPYLPSSKEDALSKINTLLK